jgi:deoxyribonuclease-4
MYGLHINSDPNLICDELNKYKNLKCIQMFINITDKYEKEYEKFKNIAKENKQNIIIHLSYTINIAQTWSEYSWWITQCILEIKKAHKLNSKYVVLHLGKSLDLDINIAINNMYSSLLYIANKLKEIPIKILLETSSGQGSEMCIKIDELAKFMNKLLQNKNKHISEKFGICIDTCHIFNAGYTLNNSKNVTDYLKEFDKFIGVKNIKLIHLNNSKTELNSRLDRHDNLEYGKINLEGIIQIIRFAKKLEIPLILETPDIHIKDDIDFLKKKYKVL